MLPRPNCTRVGAEPLSCHLTVAFWPAVNVVVDVGLVIYLHVATSSAMSNELLLETRTKTLASAEAARASGTIAAVNILGENEWDEK